MRRHPLITATLLALVVGCLLVPPASASNPLLSGYGGPGEGNQAIIGATLVGGEGGGGSGGGTGSSYPSIAVESASGASRQSQGSAVTGASETARGRKEGTISHGNRPASRGGAGSGTAARRSGSVPVLRTAAAAQPLGLGGADVLYAILVALVLAATAILTARLGRGGRTASR